MKQTTLLVGNCDSGEFQGFEARFEGEELASYAEDDAERIIVTLYECDSDGRQKYFRVHVSDESNPKVPKYTLYPYEEPSPPAILPDYMNLYTARQVIKEWPIFARYLGVLRTYDI